MVGRGCRWEPGSSLSCCRHRTYPLSRKFGKQLKSDVKMRCQGVLKHYNVYIKVSRDADMIGLWGISISTASLHQHHSLPPLMFLRSRPGFSRCTRCPALLSFLLLEDFPLPPVTVMLIFLLLFCLLITHMLHCPCFPPLLSSIFHATESASILGVGRARPSPACQNIIFYHSTPLHLLKPSCASSVFGVERPSCASSWPVLFVYPSFTIFF